MLRVGHRVLERREHQRLLQLLQHLVDHTFLAKLHLRGEGLELLTKALHIEHNLFGPPSRHNVLQDTPHAYRRSITFLRVLLLAKHDS